MTDDEVLVGLLLEDAWLSLEQVAGACAVDTAWLLARLQADLFPEALLFGSNGVECSDRSAPVSVGGQGRID